MLFRSSACTTGEPAAKTFDTTMSRARIHQVDILVYPRFKALEAVITMSVFQYANNIHLTRHGLAMGYRAIVASCALGSVDSDMAMSLEAASKVGTLDLPDIAITMGARAIGGSLKNNAGLIRWARAATARIDQFAGLCSGTFFLAAARLREGLRATTHWSASTLLQASFPGVQVDSNAIYVRVGQPWNLADVTAGIDLAPAWAEEDHGRGLALEVARDLVVYLQRPGGQSPLNVHLAGQNTNHPGIRAVRDWFLSSLDQSLVSAALVQRVRR